MKLYDKDGHLLLDVILEKSSYRYRAIKDEDTLTLRYALPEHVELPLGTYCEYQGTRYTLNNPESIKKQHTRHFDYTVTLEAEYAKGRIWKFRNPVSGRLKFSLTATPREHLQMFIDNMNARDRGWEIGDCIEAAELLISYDHDFCLDALKRQATAFETEYEIEGKRVSLKKVEYNKNNPLTLSYGRGNGFKSGVGRYNTDDQPPTERLYVQGGERNIDRSTYGNSTLLLPPSQRIRFDGQHFEDEEGFNAAEARTYEADDLGLSIRNIERPLTSLAESSLDASNIYPKRVGVVTSSVVVNANKHFYDFVDNTIPTALNYEDYLIAGEKMSVIFQTGMLAGREFEVKYYHDVKSGKAARRFEIIPQEIDGLTMPNAEFRPNVGDKYAVFHCTLPQSYIQDNATKSGASWDMMRAAVRHLFDNEEPRYTFNGEMDGIWAWGEWERIKSHIRLGGYIRFFDPQFETRGVLVRIVGIRNNISNPYSPTIELSNQTIREGMRAEIQRLRSEEVTRDEQHREALQYTKRRFRDAQATMAALEGAIEGYSESIHPIAIQTMGLLAGDESLQFRYVANRTAVQSVEDGVHYDTDTKRLIAPARMVQHMTLGITTLSSEHRPEEYRFWEVARFESKQISPEKRYYLYIKASKSSDTATYELRREKVNLEDGAYYYLLVGILNAQHQGQRSFAPLYGYTEVLPARVTTSKVISADGDSYFDLEQNKLKLGDALKFNENGNGDLELRGSVVVNPSGHRAPIACYRGEYNPANIYFAGDEVTHTSDNITSTYRYIHPTPTNTAPTSSIHWQVIAQGVKGEDGKEIAQVNITSTHGAVFRNGEGRTQLTASVTEAGRDITADLPAWAFVWTRQSGNAQADEAWNARHNGVGKQITIEASEVESTVQYSVSIQRAIVREDAPAVGRNYALGTAVNPIEEAKIDHPHVVARSYALSPDFWEKIRQGERDIVLSAVMGAATARKAKTTGGFVFPHFLTLLGFEYEDKSIQGASLHIRHFVDLNAEESTLPVLRRSSHVRLKGIPKRVSHTHFIVSNGHYTDVVAKEFKVEFGTEATPWTPALEELPKEPETETLGVGNITLTAVYDGRDGAQGAQGEKGDKGERGERGAQGLQGAAGRDGRDGTNGVSIVAVDVEYAASNSATIAPQSGWQTTPPAWQNGRYIWSRTKTILSNSNTARYSKAVCITGAKGEQGAAGRDGTNGSNGKDGRGVVSITEQYALTFNKNTPAEGAWQTTPPAWQVGSYLWTRSLIRYTDNTSETTQPLVSSEWEAVQSIEVGGVNLFGFNKNVGLYTSNDGRFNVTNDFDNGGFTISVLQAVNTQTLAVRAQNLGFERAGYYSVSFEVKCSRTLAQKPLQVDICDSVGEYAALTTEWQRVKLTRYVAQHYQKETYNGFVDFEILANSGLRVGDTISVRYLMVERGNQPTAYKPAQEDTDAKIQNYAYLKELLQQPAGAEKGAVFGGIIQAKDQDGEVRAFINGLAGKPAFAAGVERFGTGNDSYRTYFDFDGNGKVGGLHFSNVGGQPKLCIKDVQGEERVSFHQADLPTIEYLSNRSGAPKSTPAEQGTCACPSELNTFIWEQWQSTKRLLVERDGGTLTLKASLELRAEGYIKQNDNEFGGGNSANGTAPIVSDYDTTRYPFAAFADLELVRVGHEDEPYHKLASIGVHGKGDIAEFANEEINVTLRDVKQGTYFLRIVCHSGSCKTANATLTMKTPLDVRFDVLDRRIHIASNGIAVHKNAQQYTRIEDGMIVTRGLMNAPGVLYCGMVDTQPLIQQPWGIAHSPKRPLKHGRGQYRIYHNVGHTNYNVILTPRIEWGGTPQVPRPQLKPLFFAVLEANAWDTLICVYDYLGHLQDCEFYFSIIGDNFPKPQ